MKTLTNLNFKKIVCASILALSFVFVLCIANTLSSYASDDFICDWYDEDAHDIEFTKHSSDDFYCDWGIDWYNDDAYDIDRDTDPQYSPGHDFEFNDEDDSNQKSPYDPETPKTVYEAFEFWATDYNIKLTSAIDIYKFYTWNNFNGLFLNYCNVDAVKKEFLSSLETFIVNDNTVNLKDLPINDENRRLFYDDYFIKDCFIRWIKSDSNRYESVRNNCLDAIVPANYRTIELWAEESDGNNIKTALGVDLFRFYDKDHLNPFFSHFLDKYCDVKDVKTKFLSYCDEWLKNNRDYIQVTKDGIIKLNSLDFSMNYIFVYWCQSDTEFYNCLAKSCTLAFMEAKYNTNVSISSTDRCE